jgi:hypothetical protein
MPTGNDPIARFTIMVLIRRLCPPLTTWKSHGSSITLDYVGQFEAPAGLITIVDDHAAQKARDRQRSKAAL